MKLYLGLTPTLALGREEIMRKPKRSRSMYRKTEGGAAEWEKDRPSPVNHNLFHQPQLSQSNRIASSSSESSIRI
eukprot:614612-Amorphochlora_amoeboformis.AAC.1